MGDSGSESMLANASETSAYNEQVQIDDDFSKYLTTDVQDTMSLESTVDEPLDSSGTPNLFCHTLARVQITNHSQRAGET